MMIVVSHNTAMECWLSGRFDTLLGTRSITARHRPAGSIDVERIADLIATDRLEITYGEAFEFEKARADASSSFKPTAREIRRLKGGALDFVSDPLHVLVPSKNAVNGIRSVSCHVRSAPLPVGSFIRADNDLLICSPELCFAQMASIMPFANLVKLGFELCALYSLQPNGQASYQRTLPPTTPRALGSYLKRCNGMKGLADARKAVRAIATASGSPMETALAIVLSLPLRHGGYGLPRPSMNYRIDTRRRMRRSAEKRYYLCDLYWPEASIALEYDSDLEHTGPERIASDALRRNDLAALGVTMITATRDQVMDAGKLDSLARQIGRMLGVRMRNERRRSAYEHERLFRSFISS